MPFLDQVLDAPSYGFERQGQLYVPSRSEIFAEFRRKLNVFESRKNWISVLFWGASLAMAIPLVLFLGFYFSWTLLAIGLVYSMVALGSHGTIWLHRYCTHRAFQFRNPIAREICRNLVIKFIPEEIYVVSHHVHHYISEQPGDPYNVHGGWLYCFLADANHQTLNKTLSREDYARVCKMLDHTGVRLNSYEQYLRWGSLAHPAWSLAHYALNWGFWFGCFWLMGGLGLALAIFGMAGVWAIGVRTFNYDGHGRGRDRRRDGVDFHRGDWSVNQTWPGFVAGEWHNNHHLYPSSARCGFLRGQLDLPWLFVLSWSKLGLVTRYRDNRADFLRDYYLPYVEAKLKGVQTDATIAL